MNKLTKNIKADAKKYEQLIYGLPVAVYTCDANGYIQLYNNAAVELWGRTPVIGKDLWCGSWKMFNGSGTAVSRDASPMAIALKEGRIFNPEIIFERLDGTIRHVISHPQLVYDDAGKITGTINTIFDITEQVTGRKKIEESEARLSNEQHVLYNSFMNSPSGIVILQGPTHIYEFANSLYEKIVGKKISIGKTVRELFPEIEQQGLLNILDNVFNTGEPFIANELLVELNRNGNGILDKIYMNLVVQPLKAESGKTQRLLAHLTDVTEQVNTRKRIEESEAKFRNFIVQAPVLISTFQGPSFIIETVNKTALEIWGKSYDQVINKPLFEVSPEMEDGLKGILNNIYTTGEPFIANEIQVQLKRKGKSDTAYFNSVYQPLRDFDNKIYGIILIGTEVTEAVIARQKIEASENQLRQIADMMPQMVWTATPDGFLDYYNKQWYEYTGFEEGYGDQSWIPILHADDVQHCIDTWYHSIKTGEPYQIEYRFKNRKNPGTFRWFLGRATPLRDKEGNIIKWFGTCTDIEEAKKLTQEKFLLEFAEDFSHYKSGTEFFNSLVKYIADKTGMDYVFVGELVEKFSPSNQEKYFDVKTLALANNGKLLPNIEFPLAHSPCEQVIKGIFCSYPKDCMQLFSKNEMGKKLKVDGYVGYALYNLEGEPIGMVSVMHEKGIENPEYVSALLKIIAKRAEFEMERNTNAYKLKEKNLALEHKNAELESFTYVASHDLKEPLRKIQMFCRRILETENFTDKTQNYFNRIIGAGERMQNLIDSLLDISHISAAELIFEPCNLNAIVEDVKNNLHERILEKQAVIESENLPTINGVHIQIEQLITNLLDNAFKYSRQEVKPHIKISYSLINGNKMDHPQANKQREYHAIKIADNGIGFDKEYETKIFELFQRLHGKNEYSGTGIGLAICKKIAGKHNGFIVAEGELGVGATFTFYIPK